MAIETIGERLKYFREMYKINQDTLVQELKNVDYKISLSTYQRIEQDKTEASLEFILAFISVLNKLPVKEGFGDKPISIFSFVYPDINDTKDNGELKAYNDAIFNIFHLPKYFDTHLFGDLFDTKQPFYKYFLGCSEFLPLLSDLEPQFRELKNIHTKRQEIEKQIIKDSKKSLTKNEQKNYIEKQHAKPEYKKYLQQQNTIINGIQYNFKEFAKKLINYFLEHQKSPLTNSGLLLCYLVFASIYIFTGDLPRLCVLPFLTPFARFKISITVFYQSKGKKSYI